MKLKLILPLTLFAASACMAETVVYGPAQDQNFVTKQIVPGQYVLSTYGDLHPDAVKVMSSQAEAACNKIGAKSEKVDIQIVPYQRVGQAPDPAKEPKGVGSFHYIFKCVKP